MQKAMPLGKVMAFRMLTKEDKETQAHLRPHPWCLALRSLQSEAEHDMSNWMLHVYYYRNYAHSKGKRNQHFGVIQVEGGEEQGPFCATYLDFFM